MGHVTHVEEIRNTFKILAVKPQNNLDHMGYLGIEKKVGFNGFLQKYGVKLWTRLN